MKYKTYAVHVSEELDRQLQEAFMDGFQAFRPMNRFIRYLVTVGLQRIVFERKLQRTRTEARLAAAGGGYVPASPEPEPADIQAFLQALKPKRETGVKAAIIPFPGRS